MWNQILAIGWAQFRTMRNHLPRTNVGAVLVWLAGLIWYGIFAAVAVVLAIVLAHLPLQELRQGLPVGLLAVFAFWQIVPLFTLSSGWSLQLNKLQVYPVSNSALFGIEVLLRVSTAPEMIIVLVGAFIGLVRHHDISWFWPLFLLVFIPLNLFLSLGIREFILHAFARNRFRELFAILIISIAVLPQLLTRTGLGQQMAPYFLRVARARFTPWAEVANVSLGRFSIADLLVFVFVWTAICYFFARRQFLTGLRQDEGFRAGPAILKPDNAKAEKAPSRGLLDLPNRLFKDPMAALLQKEFQSLFRMPRFRVIFGMACVFSVIVFIPMGLNRHNPAQSFIQTNFLPVVTLYGLLILSDLVLLNVFGLDRLAAQIYFVAPVPFELVLKAKNLTAITFIALQAGAVLLVASLMRWSVTPFSIANAIGAAAVVGVFLLSVGNYTSIALARPIDPSQTFKKQAGAKFQFWLLLCSIGMFVLVGFAFLARFALHSDWASPAVLLIEFAVGFICYRIATQSAVERGLRQREQLIEALSKGASPIGLGLS